MSSGNVYLKLTSTMSVFASKFVHNFHKKFKDVVSIEDLHYAQPNSRENAYDIYFPLFNENKKLPIAIYIHGGGWTTLDKSMYQTLCRRFAQKGFVVFNVNYGLAPKTPIEDMVISLENAIEYIVSNYKNNIANYSKKLTQNIDIDKESIILVGDSAGAHLASIITARANNPDYEKSIKFYIQKKVNFTSQPNTLLCNTKSENAINHSNSFCILDNPCEPSINKLPYFANNLSLSENIKYSGCNSNSCNNQNNKILIKVNNYLKNKVKALILFYGVFDFSTLRSTGFRNINKFMNALFVNDGVENKSKIFAYSTVNFVTNKFPPTFIASGEIDKLHVSQSKNFAELLESKNIPVEKVFFNKNEFFGKHGFMSVDGIVTNITTHNQIDEFLKKYLK